MLTGLLLLDRADVDAGTLLVVVATISLKMLLSRLALISLKVLTSLGRAVYHSGIVVIVVNVSVTVAADGMLYVAVAANSLHSPKADEKL